MILSMGVSVMGSLSIAKSFMFFRLHLVEKCRIDIHWVMVFSVSRRKVLNVCLVIVVLV